MMQSPSSPPYQLRGHIVAPRGIDEIRQSAVNASEVLGLSDQVVPLSNFIESLSAFGITVDVVDDENQVFVMTGVEAVCVPETATIYLTEATYAAARRDDPRTRFTVFHELGHFVLQHNKAMARHNYVAKAYLDSEWQADQFAAEMTMPLETILRLRLFTPTQIAQHFRVSLPAAIKRVTQLRKYGSIK